MKYFFVCLACFISCNLLAHVSDSLYKEKYRPQYHFTPKHRWIGDPCGLIKHSGKYLAYSWGAAVSDDLVYWNELNDHAIKQVPEGISTFTGSVVIDKNNTAGWGNNVPIAVFTSFDEASKKQSQSIAFSHDGGMTYMFYDRNPVLDIWSTEFRDPTVIWDEGSKRWIMLVAKALEKKVAFYSSTDMKHWTWLSDFGPLGYSEKSWECPDMFQLPLDNLPAGKKWVLVVSVNWMREQYFIGEFDGVKFIPDNTGDYPLYIDKGLDYYASRVFRDYDDSSAPVYTIGWLNTWDYAETAPTTWGKGIWSVPREYRLRNTPEGLRLIQKPFDGLSKLRGARHTFKRKIKAGLTEIPFVKEMNNVYELDVTFSNMGNKPVGIFLCEGENKKAVLSYDPQSQYITLDRTNVSQTAIPKFERMSSCKVPAVNGRIRFHCYVDKSSVEIFVNDGEATLSFLTFPSDNQTGCSVFSLGMANVDLTAWKLKSIW